MTIKEIQTLITDEMAQVETLLLARISCGNNHLIQKIGSSLFKNKGKRIRPIITILAACALNYQGDKHLIVAAAIEFIHTATLLHDDVVDVATLRRGKNTTNIEFGNATSVLMGDYIYTRAFQMLIESRSLPVLELISTATNIVATGEIEQLQQRYNQNIEEQAYRQIIYKKTAPLFEAALQAGGLLAGADQQLQLALKTYGHHLGIAFQLMDDVLDYQSTDAVLGKKIGADFKEGKITLPLLHALKQSNQQQRKMIAQALAEPQQQYLFDQVKQIICTHGSLDYVKEQAKLEADAAIASLHYLPHNKYREALKKLAQLASQRNY